MDTFICFAILLIYMYVSLIYLYQKKIYVLGINMSYVYIIARYQSDIKRQDYVYVK